MKEEEPESVAGILMSMKSSAGVNKKETTHQDVVGVLMSLREADI